MRAMSRAGVVRTLATAFSLLVVGSVPAAYAPQNYEIVTNSGVGPQHPTCPGTKKVLGGGLTASVPFFGSRPETPGTSWYASAGATAFITAFAICADVDASYEIVTASGVMPQLVTCPGTKKVTGGGADSTVQLFGSRPEPPGNSWYASAGPGGAFLTAYAICMDVDPSYEIVTAGGVVPQIPQCPTLKAVTGGGLDSTVQLFGSAPEVPGWGWYASAGPSGAFLTSYAICMTTPYPGEAQSVVASRGGGTSVNLSYRPACGALDHTIYWGTSPIAGTASWTNAACGLGTSGSGSFDPGTPAAGKFVYYVIVGKNAANEGSYGTSSSAERPEAVGVGACDAPQLLGSTCPP